VRTLVFDASPLVHFARAGEFEVLKQLVNGYRCVTTRAVRDELQRGAAKDARLHEALNVPWLETVSTDELEVLYAFAAYMDRLGNRTRNAGEATVLAWAEVHAATAFVDDQVACNVGRQRRVTVRRTLGLIIDGYRRGLFSEDRAQQLVNALAEEDARFPQEARHDLFDWARQQGLLEP
jgi:predicted nucleic acid-binding protein